MTPTKLTRTQLNEGQIRMLQRLTPRAAAALVDLTDRTLRDGKCPRNPDGTYNAQEVVRWAAARSAPDFSTLHEDGRFIIGDGRAGALVRVLLPYQAEDPQPAPIRIVAAPK